MRCEWIDPDARPLVCKNCGLPCDICKTNTARRTCEAGKAGEPRKGPSLARRAKNFTVAATKHVARGRPQADQAAIDARLAICVACPLYDPKRSICTHEDCGCAVSAKRKFLNKLAWADQVCPDKPPRW